MPVIAESTADLLAERAPTATMFGTSIRSTSPSCRPRARLHLLDDLEPVLEVPREHLVEQPGVVGQRHRARQAPPPPARPIARGSGAASGTAGSGTVCGARQRRVCAQGDASRRVGSARAHQQRSPSGLFHQQRMISA